MTLRSFLRSAVTLVSLMLCIPVAATAACYPGTVLQMSDIASLDQVGSSGNRVSLPTALRTILPGEGWIIEDATANRKPVSFRAGEDWMTTLSGVLKQAVACANVDPGQKKIMILAADWSAGPTQAATSRTVATTPAAAAAPRTTNPTPAPPAKPAPTSSGYQFSAPPSSSSSAPTAPVTTAPIAEPLRAEINRMANYFDLRTSESLRTNIERWAKLAGYTLVWKADVDYAVDAPLTLPDNYSFEQAVTHVMDAYWDSTHTLTATLYRNRVLVITKANGR